MDFFLFQMWKKELSIYPDFLLHIRAFDANIVVSMRAIILSPFTTSSSVLIENQ